MKIELKPKEKPPVDFEILEKLPNDHCNALLFHYVTVITVEPAILRFTEDKLICADKQSGKAKKNCIWSYDKIQSAVIRARHQHMDIKYAHDSSIMTRVRFSDPKLERFRLCSSYLQGIVNELSLRVKSLAVVFETGARQFSYGKPVYSQRAPQGSKNGFFRRGPQKPITETILTNVDDKTKQELLQQEQDLEDLSSVLGDLHMIGTAMGCEIDRQNEQLDHITTRVDEANAKLKATNKRIDKLL